LEPGDACKTIHDAVYIAEIYKVVGKRASAALEEAVRRLSQPEVCIRYSGGRSAIGSKSLFSVEKSQGERYKLLKT
jgi:hypothetical protein